MFQFPARLKYAGWAVVVLCVYQVKKFNLLGKLEPYKNILYDLRQGQLQDNLYGEEKVVQVSVWRE